MLHLGAECINKARGGRRSKDASTYRPTPQLGRAANGLRHACVINSAARR